MTFMFIGCEKETSQRDLQPSKNTSDIAILESMGFCSADIEDLGDHYLVEGDIRFDKEDMHYYTPTTRQYHCGWLVGYNNQQNITVRIDNSLINQSNWADAIIAAINAWNSEPDCNIRMTYVTSPIADITFSYASLLRYINGVPVGRAIARSTFPRNDMPGPTVQVDTYWNFLTLGEKTWVMMHELGHNFGLRHTDYMNRADDGSNEGTPIDRETGNRIDAIHIPGTPTNNSDNRSLMWSIANDRSYPTYSFSDYDKIALKNMYPNPTITGPDSPGLYTFATYTIPTDMPTGTIFNGWEVTPNSYSAPKGMRDSNLDIGFTTVARYTLKANFTLPGGMDYSTTITVVVLPDLPNILCAAEKLTFPERETIGLWDEVVYWTKPDQFVTFDADNDEYCEYEWTSFDPLELKSGLGNVFETGVSSDNYQEPSLYTIKCRAKLNGLYSDWVDIYLYISAERSEIY